MDRRVKPGGDEFFLKLRRPSPGRFAADLFRNGEREGWSLERDDFRLVNSLNS
jgi:hypothetical protein